MAEAPERESRVRAALVETLYAQALPTAGAAGLVILAFAAFQLERQPLPRLGAWLAIQSAPVASGLYAGLAYRRRGDTRSSARWLRLYLVNLCALAGAWGLGTLLFFEPDDLVGTTLTIVFSGGVTAGALLGASCHPWAFSAFALLALMPTLVQCLAMGGRAYTTMGLGLVAFLLFSFAASRNVHRSLRASIELGLDNHDLARRLSEEKERAEAALAQKSRFLAAASHDLRQPLHALAMFVELLDGHVKGDEARHFLTRIRASSRALAGLLNGLLDISRLDSAAITVRREHMSLEPLFEQVAAEFGELARQKGLELRTRGTEVLVQSDRELLARIVRNLLSNAVRFTSEGEIVLSARRVAPGRVELSVSDTGPGIPVEQQPRVWEEFYQLGNPERDRDQGLGLGLSIVRGLGKLLSHPVRLRSAPERQLGSEFVVELPEGDARELAEQPATSSRRLGSMLDGQRVFVIDDERDIRDSLTALLRSWGCVAEGFGGVGAAIAGLDAGLAQPHVVVCDYRLRDGMTGAEALAELGARCSEPFAAVIVTGDTSPERISEATSAGRPLLFKPVVPGKLRALLGSLSERAGRSATAS